MAPTIPDAILDLSLAGIATCTAVHACTSEPANHAGIAAVSVGSYTLTAGHGNGDFTIANGDTSGRKVTLEAQSGNNGTASGAANDLAFTDGSTLKAVILADGDTVNNGSPWTIAQTKVWESRDPT